MTAPTTVAQILPAARTAIATGAFQTVEVDGSSTILDHFTASIVTQVYDALAPGHQAKADAMSFNRFLTWAWKVTT